VQAFRPLLGSEVAEIEAGTRNLDEAVGELVKSTSTDTAVTALDLIGWYALRPAGALQPSDIDFHQRTFGQSLGLALLVHSVDGGFLRFDFYTAAGLDGMGDVAWQSGDARFSPAHAATEPVQVALLGRKERVRAAAASTGVVYAEPAWLTKVQPVSAPAKRTEALVPTREITVPAATVPSQRRFPWFWVTLLFAVAGGITFAVLLWPVVPLPTTAAATARGTHASPALYLRAESEGERILLSWDRQNQVAQRATDANLVIDDGAAHRNIHLDSKQVSNGAVLYRPVSDDVSFRLEIHGQDGGSAAETLHIMDRGRAAAQPFDVSTPAPEKNGSSADKNAQAEEPNVPPASAPKHLWEPVPALNETPRPFEHLAPTPAAPVRPEFQKTVEPAPEVHVAANENPLQQFDLNGFNVTVPPAPKTPDVESTPPAKEPQPVLLKKEPPTRETLQATTSPAVTPAQPQPANIPSSKPAASPLPASRGFDTRYVSPRPVYQVLPDISQLPQVMRSTAGEVSVVVNIDPAGHVTAARIEFKNPKPPGAIIAAAENAARKWVFEPARLDGRPIPSEHSIVFRFGR
jgi:protein TonB